MLHTLFFHAHSTNGHKTGQTTCMHLPTCNIQLQCACCSYTFPGIITSAIPGSTPGMAWQMSSALLSSSRSWRWLCCCVWGHTFVLNGTLEVCLGGWDLHKYASTYNVVHESIEQIPLLFLSRQKGLLKWLRWSQVCISCTWHAVSYPSFI